MEADFDVSALAEELEVACVSSGEEIQLLGGLFDGGVGAITLRNESGLVSRKQKDGTRGGDCGLVGVCGSGVFGWRRILNLGRKHTQVNHGVARAFSRAWQMDMAAANVEVSIILNT